MGAAWFTVRRLNAMSSDYTIANRTQNAAVLARAKQALMGYVAHQAAISGENNPGAFPCPEAPGSFNSSAGTDGKTQTPSCALPAVGRFPWRTIGSEQFVDAAGEPLWYVVASGWSKPGPLATDTTTINSNCNDPTSGLTCWNGQLTVDGVPNAAVALIIAPGAPITVPAGACAAWAQTRPNAPPPDLRNYLECENASSPADASFVTTGPAGSFNDQVIKITAAEILPLIEGAVADRFQQEFAPLMRTAHSGGGVWPVTPALPFAATFGDPTVNPGNKLQGAAATLGGLLPATYSYVGTCTCGGPAPCVCPAPPACTVAPADPRCDPAFVSWRSTANAGCASAACTSIAQTGGASLHASSNCTVAGTPSVLTCTINGYVSLLQLLGGTDWMTFNLDAVAANAGMTWKKLNLPTAAAPAIAGIDTAYANSPVGYNLTSAAFNADGSATVRVNARVQLTGGTVLGVLGVITCNISGTPLCYSTTVTIPMALFTDQDFLDPNNATYNWFFRNRWHEVTYYAVAPGIAPSGARSCTLATCLQVNYSADLGKHGGVLVFGGQKLTTLDAAGNPYTQARPATQAKDLLDDINADGASPFELRSTALVTNRAFNDRFGVIFKYP